MKRILTAFTAAALVLSLLMLPGISAAALPFEDVRGGDWFYDAVEQMYNDGLINGRTPTRYDPQGTMTRAELVVLMSRISGEDVSNFGIYADGFGDVGQNSWYRSYVGWAARRGLVNGYDGGRTFKPESPILRQEFAALIVRLTDYLDSVLPREPKIEKFSDANDIPGWAADNIEELRVTGLAAGDERGRFNPGATLTRAEAAMLLSRFTAALKLDPMYGIFDRAEEISETVENGRIVIFAGAAESLTADSLNDLILAALGLDRGTYELELDPGEVDAVRQGDYGKLSPGDRIETELTAAVRNSLTGQSTQRRKLPLILGRSEDIPEEMYPEFYYKIKLDGTAEITDYVGNDSIRTLTVPSSLGGVKVTSIGELAFSECRELEAVTIPKTVTRIGERALALCTSLDGVSIPDSVTEVGRAAFYFCTSLKGVRLPSRLRYIPDYMFYMCTSLENVLPPEELREIGAYAFCCCKLSSFGFGDGIERIGDYSFEGCALRSVRVPDTCDYVGNWSFYNCASLSDVYLGRGLTQLGSGIFYGTAVTDVSYGGTASEYSAIVKKSTLMGDQKIVCEGGNR